MIGSALNFTKNVAGALLLSATMAASAHALPQFTFNPAAVGLNGTAFTADNFILTDYATATLVPNGSGGADFTEPGVLPVGAINPIALANGTLISGGVGATEVAGVAVPNANTLLTFAPTAAGASFFVDPNPFYQAVFAAFTNNPSQITVTDTGFVITQGGGSANFLVTATPEPASMALLGAGLLGLGFLRRRTAA